MGRSNSMVSMRLGNFRKPFVTQIPSRHLGGNTVFFCVSLRFKTFDKKWDRQFIRHGLHQLRIAIRFRAAQLKIAVCHPKFQPAFPKQVQHDHRIYPATHRQQGWSLVGQLAS